MFTLPAHVVTRFDSKKTKEAEDVDSFFAKLITLSWVPVQQTPSVENYPWISDPTPIASPRKMRSHADVWLCSASIPVCKEKIKSPLLLERFGWLKPLPPSALVCQLQALSRAQEVDNALAGTINRYVAGLYTQLGSPSEDTIEALKSFKSVWVGTRFAHPAKTAFRCFIDCQPYLWSLPRMLQTQDLLPLFKAIGVLPKFSVSEYLSAIVAMRDHQVYVQLTQLSNLKTRLLKKKRNLSMTSI